jgi:hypothetical protein
MLAAGVDVLAAIPGAEPARDADTPVEDRAGLGEGDAGDREWVAARTVDDRGRLAASGWLLAGVEEVARRKRIRGRTLQDRLATDLERDDSRLLVGGSFEFEDALSEIVSDIATAWWQRR